MKVAVTGATGMIGKRLCLELLKTKTQLIILARNPEKAQSLFPRARVIEWDVLSGPPPKMSLVGMDAVVHLAGEGIAESHWTPTRRQAIRDSRVEGTRNLVAGLRRSGSPPALLISGSAIGFYGSRNNEKLDESSAGGGGFLGEVCRAWEQEAKRAEELEIRTVLLRTGIVLSPEGGALAKMLTPFKMFVGGALGSGRQWMSWIHIDDEVGLIRHILEGAIRQGPVNATAPRPVTNFEFSKTLGRVLGRPSFLAVPSLVIKLLLGDMGEELLLNGQRVYPEQALESGYSFKFPELEGALRDLLQGVSSKEAASK